MSWELFDEGPHYNDAESAEAKCEVLREAMIHMTQAMQYMNQMVVELAAHTNEHHEVINSLGRAVETLEALMIGGNDAASTP